MAKAIAQSRPAASLYEADFHAWARHQALALEKRDRRALDLVNLADEVESLGRSQRHAVESHLEILVAHLLKLRVQPEKASPSWHVTVRNQRREIARIIARSPSLRSLPGDLLAAVYPDAVRLASKETKIEQRSFPNLCPFTIEQIMAPEFEP